MTLENRPFVNGPTRDVFLCVVTDWIRDGDPADVAQQWLDIGCAGAVELLAGQLKRDLAETYAAEKQDALAVGLARYALRRVDFMEVADRLLSCARVPAAGDGQASDGQAEA